MKRITLMLLAIYIISCQSHQSSGIQSEIDTIHYQRIIEDALLKHIASPATYNCISFKVYEHTLGDEYDSQINQAGMTIKAIDELAEKGSADGKKWLENRRNKVFKRLKYLESTMPKDPDSLNMVISRVTSLIYDSQNVYGAIIRNECAASLDANDKIRYIFYAKNGTEKDFENFDNSPLIQGLEQFDDIGF